MTVRKEASPDGQVHVQLLDREGNPIPIVDAFLRYLAARDYSPNTLIAYVHDLQHLWQFLEYNKLAWQAFRPRHSIGLLEFLRVLTTTRRVRRLTPTCAVLANGVAATRLAPTTINRALAAVSSFYEFAILTDQFDFQNPIEKCVDTATQRVSQRHRPFMDGASRQRPLRRRVSVKAVNRLPRLLPDAERKGKNVPSSMS